MAICVPRIIQAKLRRTSFSSYSTATSTPIVFQRDILRFTLEKQSSEETISFRELLSQAEEEFGFDHPTGGLTIPCREDAPPSNSVGPNM
ncbi:hypothetical protein Leryth_011538 [Lithospermum erythrorhizon]|nr:hypothetical protein Leryth_011538 [Lithospermum erythrorhizon]